MFSDMGNTVLSPALSELVSYSKQIETFDNINLFKKFVDLSIDDQKQFVELCRELPYEIITSIYLFYQRGFSVNDNPKGLEPDKTKADVCKQILIDMKDSNPDRFLTLGLIFQEDKNYPEMFKYMELAEEKGALDAIVRLGELLMNDSYGRKPDGKRAFELFTKAATKFNKPRGYTGLGELYFYGIGVEIDMGLAQTNLEKGIEMGQSDFKPRLILAKIYRSKIKEDEKYRQMAINHLRTILPQAACYNEARFELARCLLATNLYNLNLMSNLIEGRQIFESLADLLKF